MLSNFRDALSKYILDKNINVANIANANNANANINVDNEININFNNNNDENSFREDAILIIDGSNFFIRAHSLCAHNNLSDFYNYISTLLTLINTQYQLYNIKDIFVAIDGFNNNSVRTNIYEDYKSGSHVNATKKIILNKMLIGNILSNLSIKYINTNNYEADDLISFLAHKTDYAKVKNVIIVTSDKDYYQLISNNVKIYNPIKKSIIDKEWLYNEFKIKNPKDFIYYKIIIGDGSDNIKGIRGIGDKTFIKLISSTGIFEETEIENVDVFLNKISSYYSDKTKIRIILDNKELLERNFNLMNLYLYEQNISNAEKLKILEYINKPYSEVDNTTTEIIELYKKYERNLNQKNVQWLLNKLITYFKYRIKT